MNPFLLIYIVSGLIVLGVGCYEAYVDYNRGMPIKLTSGILGLVLLTFFPVVNTLIVTYIAFSVICDNPTILKGKL